MAIILYLKIKTSQLFILFFKTLARDIQKETTARAVASAGFITDNRRNDDPFGQRTIGPSVFDNRATILSSSITLQIWEAAIFQWKMIQTVAIHSSFFFPFKTLDVFKKNSNRI